MTVYFPDISGWQPGIDLSAALIAAIKATEGTGYTSYEWGRQCDEADRHAAYKLGYHFMHQGNGGGQAGYAYSRIGKIPAMCDLEPIPKIGSYPTVGDTAAYIDAYRKLGGTCWWLYFPKWYWEQLGRPSLKPLTDRGLLLWSSDYGVPYTDAASGRGWQPYGGMTPLIWQYTSTLNFGGQANVDFSAFRGSAYAGKQDDASVHAALAEFRSLSQAGRWPAAPGEWTYDPPVSAAARPGAHSVTLSWTPAMLPAGRARPVFSVWIYRGRTASRGTVIPSYPRTGIAETSHLFGSLDPAVTGTHNYTAHVAAVGAGGDHMRDHAYASVNFTVSGLRLDRRAGLRGRGWPAARPRATMDLVRPLPG
jgi:Glycosyl hydrolases family 25